MKRPEFYISNVVEFESVDDFIIGCSLRVSTNRIFVKQCQNLKGFLILRGESEQTRARQIDIRNLRVSIYSIEFGSCPDHLDVRVTGGVCSAKNSRFGEF